jgi:hypothetical protein
VTEPVYYVRPDAVKLATELLARREERGVKYGRVSLDGETFAIKIDEDKTESDGGYTYYPMEMRHESSGMMFDGTSQYAELAEVYADYGFAEDLMELYRRLFGRGPEATRFEVLDPPVEEK